MAQRHSEYGRLADDRYQTPSWVTGVLLNRVRFDRPMRILEPCAGDGLMVAVLRDAGHFVFASDIEPDLPGLDRVADFLDADLSDCGCDTLITNPPYNLITEMVRHALSLPYLKTIAILGGSGFDYAKLRADLFCHSRFRTKLLLQQRIVWFEGAQKGRPSTNHAWYIWGSPTNYPAELRYQVEPLPSPNPD